MSGLFASRGSTFAVAGRFRVEMDGFDSCLEIIQSKRDQLNRMAQQLLEQEKLDEDDLLAILGPRWESAPVLTLPT